MDHVARRLHSGREGRPPDSDQIVVKIFFPKQIRKPHNKIPHSNSMNSKRSRRSKTKKCRGANRKKTMQSHRPTFFRASSDFQVGQVFMNVRGDMLHITESNPDCVSYIQNQLVWWISLPQEVAGEDASKQFIKRLKKLGFGQVYNPESDREIIFQNTEENTGIRWYGVFENQCIGYQYYSLTPITVSTEQFRNLISAGGYELRNWEAFLALGEVAAAAPLAL